MLTAVDTATAIYFSGAEPTIALVSSRAAQAQVRFTTELPVFPTYGAESKPQNGSSVVEIDQPLEGARTAADTAIGQLLRFEKLEADWDGSDAAKPVAGSIREARMFIRSLSPDSVIPRPTLHADGHAILFIRNPDIYGELEFLGNNRISFYTRRGERQWSDEISFDGRTLPEGLSQVGFAL